MAGAPGSGRHTGHPSALLFFNSPGLPNSAKLPVTNTDTDTLIATVIDTLSDTVIDTVIDTAIDTQTRYL